MNANNDRNKIEKQKSDAILIEYCPKVFEKLRILDDIDKEELFK